MIGLCIRIGLASSEHQGEKGKGKGKGKGLGKGKDKSVAQPKRTAGPLGLAMLASPRSSSALFVQMVLFA